MSLLFSEGVARNYDRWFLSPEGRYVERVENQLLLELLRPAAGQTILDVGCGTGNHLLLFRQLGLDVSGLDSSEAMLEVARDKLGHRAELHLGFAEDLPFDDNSFDLVSIIATLEFCDQPTAALAEAFRVAREKVVIGALNRLSAQGTRRRRSGLATVDMLSGVRFFSIWELQSLVRRHHGGRLRWGSVIWLPLPVYRWDQALCRRFSWRKNPFAAFLGLEVKLIYTRQARMTPLLDSWLRGSRSRIRPGHVAPKEGRPCPMEPVEVKDAVEGAP
jgi:SAM-dependent methyltransferase